MVNQVTNKHESLTSREIYDRLVIRHGTSYALLPTNTTALSSLMGGIPNWTKFTTDKRCIWRRRY